MANRFRSHYLDIGVQGEELVAQWLNSRGWVVLYRRWRCRWGEIDIIARHNASSTPCLAFVEVKTRSDGNWDAGGALSITPQKQVKLRQTARCFLATHPGMAEYSCQFDVSLVCCRKLTNKHLQIASNAPQATTTMLFQSGQSGEIATYQLLLQDHIHSAFDKAISY